MSSVTMKSMQQVQCLFSDTLHTLDHTHTHPHKHPHPHKHAQKQHTYTPKQTCTQTTHTHTHKHTYTPTQTHSSNTFMLALTVCSPHLTSLIALKRLIALPSSSNMGSAKVSHIFLVVLLSVVAKQGVPPPTHTHTT